MGRQCSPHVLVRGRDLLTIARSLIPLESEASSRAQIGRLHYAANPDARTWCELHMG
jgi:hypothetical protein